ncbi:hypothetical protein Pka01_14940 [Planotetraspora kaengkrachanensis]|uniref:Uncharacterized protein n=1 Tax=Planotetraspora kaengkrachanensis TaxID=575193 RepID=A0A8J3LUA1_9ACTN|nr:hypothetical protein Pka01_14940 [Planotetraspora kaengkrachanensis]
MPAKPDTTCSTAAASGAVAANPVSAADDTISPAATAATTPDHRFLLFRTARSRRLVDDGHARDRALSVQDPKDTARP